MRAYVIADNANSIFEIPVLLVNDGHPPLWHILLFLVNTLVKSPVTLQLTAIPISVLSVFLFIKYSPFPNFIKILFIFGIIPFYEYTVFSRNYGISMLLMIVATILITNKKTQPLLFYIILSLLALTNIHSLFLCPFFVLLYLINDTNKKNHRFWVYHSLGLIVLIVSAIYSAHIALPNEDSFYGSGFPKLTELFNAGLQQVLIFGEGFRYIFLGNHPILQLLTFWFLALSLLRKPVLTLAFVIVMVGFGVFFNIGYPSWLRHEGIFYVFAVMLFWLLFSNKFNGRYSFKKIDNQYIRLASMAVFTALLLLQVKYAVDASLTVLKAPVSSNKEFARFINKNPEFKNAIFVGEPEIIMESIPYYIDNKIYFSREKRFGRRANYTTARNPAITLSDIINDARYLNKTHKETPVLILMGWIIDNNTKPDIIYTGFGLHKSFELDSCGLQNFFEHTIFLKSFRGSLTGEDYDVYLFID